MIDKLCDELNLAFTKISKNSLVESDYIVDLNLQLRDVNKNTYEAISLLAPFGEGNRKPIFSFPNVTIFSIEQFGKTKEHLKIVFVDESRTFVEAIAWFKTAENYKIPLTNGKTLTLIAYIEESRFLGRTQLRLKIIDFIENK